MFNLLLPSLLMFVFTSYSSTKDPIRIVPMAPAAEPEYVEVTIQHPEDDELKQSLPILVEVRIEGYALGINTEDQKAEEIRACPKGQTIRVVLDDNPYILLNEDDAPSDAFDNHDAWFRTQVETFIKDNIKPGDHLLRAYAAYSFGEAVRGNKTFNMSTFCFKKQGITKIDLSAPMITYNEPQGVFKGDQPILLDFLCNNCELSAGGYKVRLTIDGKEIQKLTSSNPYYIYGLSKGNHTVKLELLSPSGRVVNNPFTTPERTITIR